MEKQATSKRFRQKGYYITIAVAVVLLAVIMFVNMRLMYGLATEQSEEIGSMRMENIVTNLQQTLERAQNAVIRVGANLSELLQNNADPDEIREFLSEQKAMEVELSDGSCMNTFCVADNQVYISDMEAPEGYVVQDRNWYKGLMALNRGEVYISQVYDDAFTENMCFTVARLLDDGRTIIGLDYSIADIQASVEAMSEDGSGDALIADKDGTIVGYQDASLLGEKLSSKLPEYQSVFTKALTSGGSDASFSMVSREGQDTVFCNRTENGWYLMLRVSNRLLYRDSYIQFFSNLIVMVIVVAIFLVLYLIASRQRARAERTLEEREELLASMPESFRASLEKMIETGGRGRHAEKKGEKRALLTAKERHWFETSIIVALTLTMLLTITITTMMTMRWGRSRLEEEARGYNYEVSAWILEQKSILDLFSYTVAAQPEMLSDYDGMVGFLDQITKHYKGISATYIANPDFPHGHPMVMNNGWVPEEDYVEEERVWYTGAMEAEDFNITEPYYDARTGKYCITFSKKVETDSGEFLGVFAIDFYLDVLMEILGDGYSGTGYAFLVDKEGRIINHPNPEYQHTGEGTPNIRELVYEKIYNSSKIVILRDYDGKLKACSSMEESLSNFKVIVVNDFWMIYGDVAKYALLFLVLFGACIGAVVLLMNNMVRWQHETDVQLQEAADAARAADQAKSLFLAQMSHEIRTPINAVLGMNEMILRENNDDNIQEYAAQIQSAGTTLLALINGILDFSKIESGRMEIQPVVYETSMLILNLVNLISDRAQGKGLALNLEIDPTLPEELYGDDVRVRQIITNLLTNAVKYTQEGSVTLEIEGRRREGDDLTLYVEVKDTGIGIREEDMDRLFGMFQRLDQEKNRNIEGTGLGIPIVQNLLHMMGSELKVESVYGEGSVFSFELVQQVMSSREIGDYRQSFQRLIGREQKQQYVYAPDARILVVDDTAVNLRVVRNLLGRNGVRLDTASGGMECIERVKNTHYNIVFLDHMMPQMDGIETFAKLREEKLLPDDTAVIMMTANEIVGAREEYLKQGFTDYISKPISVKQLEEMLAKHLPPELVSYREVSKTAGQTTDGAEKSAQPEEKKAEKSASVEEKKTGKKSAQAEVEKTEAEFAQVEEEEMEAEAESAKPEEKRIGTKQEGESESETESSADDSPIPGVDMSVGLTYCAEDEEFYREMLEEYIADSTADELDGYRNAGDWDNYLVKVHALKSASRTIGAGELGEQAFALETATREGDHEFVKSNHEKLMRDYRKLLDDIRAYLDPDSSL